MYCSRACRNEGRKTGKHIPCTECGTLFYAARCIIDQGRRLCSNRCKYIQTGRRIAGDPVARFWDKVDKNGPLPASGSEYGNCWPRRGSSVNEYSVLSVEDRKMLATHFGWSLASGNPFPDGMWALHVCDYPRCVRQDGELGTYEVNGTLYPRYGHLWLGDHAANMADALKKNRVARTGNSTPGERHWGAKLTEESVRLIRVLHASGNYSHAVLAERFGVTTMTISDIGCRRSWKHLP